MTDDMTNTHDTKYRLTDAELEEVIKHIRYGVNVSVELRRLVFEVRRARENEAGVTLYPRDKAPY